MQISVDRAGFARIWARADVTVHFTHLAAAWLAIASMGALLWTVGMLISEAGARGTFPAGRVVALSVLSLTLLAALPTVWRSMRVGRSRFITASDIRVEWRTRRDSEDRAEITAAEIDVVRIRRRGWWREVVAIRGEREISTLFYGWRAEAEAVADVLRAELRLREDRSAFENFGPLVHAGPWLSRWTAEPDRAGVRISTGSGQFWIALLASFTLLVGIAVVVPIPTARDVAMSCRLGGVTLGVMVALPVLSAKLRPGRTYRLTWCNVEKRVGATMLSFAVARSPEAAVSRGRNLYVLTEANAWALLDVFPDPAAAAWACDTLLAGMRASLAAMAEKERPASAEIYSFERAPSLPRAPLPAVSEKWGKRYVDLVHEWRAMYLADRRWFRRVFEGPPFHMLPRQRPRRQFRV